MSTPVRQAWSLEELRDNALKYMTTMYGKPKDGNDPDQWYLRAGLLADFVATMWHEMPPSQEG
jgi:hypothetical protein